MYLLLGTLLQFPTQEVSARLADGSLIDSATELSEVLEPNRREQEPGHIVSRLRIPVTLSDLRSEYTRLFDHPEMPAVQRFEGLFRFFEKHPGQRDYRDAPRRFVNPAALDAERCYKKAGFVRSPELNEPADSMPTELEFMSRLYEGKLDALQAGDDEQAVFADECIEEFSRIHLHKWAIPFFEAVARESRIDFYRAVGLLGAAFMKTMLHEHAEQLSEVSAP
jgi:TorA maturation chaperone TorD